MEYKKGMKTVEDSRTEITKLLQYEHINGENRLFGGRLMAWIDEAAAVAAMRHAGGYVTTCAVDDLRFKKGAYLNDILVLIARVTYVGRTSMEVRVDTFLEDRATGMRTLINHAYLVEVHVDEAGRNGMAHAAGLRSAGSAARKVSEEARFKGQSLSGRMRTERHRMSGGHPFSTRQSEAWTSDRSKRWTRSVPGIRGVLNN